SDDPVWNVEDWKNLCNSLGKGPARDDVGNRDLISIAPLQFGEDVARLHRFGVVPQRQRESKRLPASGRFVRFTGFGEKRIQPPDISVPPSLISNRAIVFEIRLHLR